MKNLMGILGVSALVWSQLALAGSTTITNVATHKCFDDLAWSTSSGAAIGQWTCNADLNQDFNVTLNSDGSYTFQNAYNKYCLDASSAASGSHIVQYPCTGSVNQKFAVSAVSGGLRIKSMYSGLCMAIPNSSTTDGTLVQQLGCASSSSQYFSIPSLPAPAPSPSPTPSTSPSPSPSPTVTGSGGIPTPPANANVVKNIENLTNWTLCNGACAACPAYNPGCNGGKTVANMAKTVQQVSDPNPLPVADDGKAGLYQVYNGPAYADALWGHSVGQSLNYSNFIWDFWVQVNTSAVENLEFDLYTVRNGHKFMMGSQCDYANGNWQGWNAGTEHWINSSAPCPKFSTGKWHHVVMYETVNASNNTYTYHTIQIDGVSYAMNLSNEPTLSTNWGSVVGVQVQIDTNSTGLGVKEYIENMKITMW